MADDLLQKPSIAAAAAPAFALIPGLVLPQVESGPFSFANNLQYGLLIVFIAYLSTWLIALPVLRSTRRRVRWTPARIVAFGTILAASPWAGALLATFAREWASTGLRTAASHVLYLEWFPLIWLGSCGFCVALAFVALQWLLHPDRP